jgi:trk system potassium uptake protein TrkA
VLGIDFVIHPERATADDLAEAILLPGAVHAEHFADGRVTVAEVVLADRSPLVGRALRERSRVRPHAIVGLIRDGRTQAAEPGSARSAVTMSWQPRPGRTSAPWSATSLGMPRW